MKEDKREEDVKDGAGMNLCKHHFLFFSLLTFWVSLAGALVHTQTDVVQCTHTYTYTHTCTYAYTHTHTPHIKSIGLLGSNLVSQRHIFTYRNTELSISWVPKCIFVSIEDDVWAQLVHSVCLAVCISSGNCLYLVNSTTVFKTA